MPEDFTSTFLDTYFKAHAQKMQAQQFGMEQAYKQQELQQRQQQEQAQQQYQQGVLANSAAEQQYHLKDLAQREQDRQSSIQLGVLKAIGHDGEYVQAKPGEPQAMNIGGMLLRPKNAQEIGQEKLIQQETQRKMAQADLGSQYDNWVSTTEGILNKPLDPTAKANMFATITGQKEGSTFMKALGLGEPKAEGPEKQTPGELFTQIENALTGHIANTITANPKLMDDPKFAATTTQLLRSTQQHLMGFQAAGAATQVAPGIANRSNTDTEAKSIAQEIGPVDVDKDFDGFMSKYAKVASSGRYAPESLKAYLGTQVVKDPNKKDILLGLFGVGK